MHNFSNILKVLTWNSQLYPVGSFSFSSGLEYAIEAKIICNSKDLSCWIGNSIEYGNIWSDSVLLSECWKLNSNGLIEKINDLNLFATSLNQSKERYNENLEQGKSFIKITREVWKHEYISDELIYPIAYACSAFNESLSLEETIISFLHNTSSNLIMAGMKLIPLGQTDGQKILLEINEIISKKYLEVINSNINMIGTCGWISDIISMRHENQYTRLFRT